MIIAGVTFLHDQWLWGCAAIPVVGIFYLLSIRKRKENLEKFISPVLFGRVAPSWNWVKLQKKIGLRLLALFFMFLALSRPQWGNYEESVRSTGLDVMIALDVSRSMEVADVPPDRLRKAKHFLRVLLEGLSGDRVGVVAFAGSAQLSCPLTTDHSYVLEVVDQLNPNSIANQGSDLGRGLKMALQALDRGAEQLASSSSGVEEGRASRVILLISDGEDHENQWESVAKEVVQTGTRVIALGVGTSAGGPIPVKDALDQVIGYKRDHRGETVVSQFNPQSLMKFAQEVGGRYWPVTSEENEVEEIIHEMSRFSRGEREEKKITLKKERYQIPLAISFLFFFLELGMPLRNRFRKKKIASVLFALSLFGIGGGTPSSYAEVSRPSGRSTLPSYLENQKGIKALKEKKWNEAKEHFDNAQVDNPSSLELQFNQDVLKTMNKKDMAEAAQAFGKTAEQSSEQKRPDLAAQSFYNQGVALELTHKKGEALQAYVQALRENKKVPPSSFQSALEEKIRKNIERLGKESPQSNQGKDQDQDKNQGQGQSPDQNRDSDQRNDQNQDQNQNQGKNQDQDKGKNKDEGKNQKQDQDEGSDRDQNQGSQQGGSTYQSTGKRDFKSENLSPDDAKRVLSELSEKEKELQQKLERMQGRPQNLEKDW